MTSGHRLVEWKDQNPGWAALPQMSGLDFLRAMIRGEVPAPPIASLYQMMIVRADPGEVTFEWEPDQSQCSPNGTVLGGALSGPLDSALGCAVHTTLAPGQGYTSIEIKMNYLRPHAGRNGSAHLRSPRDQARHPRGLLRSDGH